MSPDLPRKIWAYAWTSPIAFAAHAPGSCSGALSDALTALDAYENGGAK